MGVRLIKDSIEEPTIAAMWDGYSRAVLIPSGIEPTGKTRTQWIETRRVWYTAMQSLMSLEMQIADRCHACVMSDDDAAQLMESMQGECFEFIAKVARNEPGF